MKDTIDQFMWGFQRHFRTSVEFGLRRALSAIGLPVEVRVVLVGFALDGDAQHEICVEPENGSLSAGHLVGVSGRAVEFFEADPESQIIYSELSLHESQLQAARRRSRVNALTEAIQASGVFEGLSFFASTSAPIGGYEVHTCVGVPTAELESVPALDESVVDRFYVGRSLQHEVIAEYLRRADQALYLPDPGADLGHSLGAPEDTVKDAAARLARGAVWRSAGMPADLLPIVNAFTSLSYERAGAGGHLVIASANNDGIRPRVRFQEPGPLQDAQSMRKLLELSDESMSVLVDYQGAHGLRAYGLGSYESGLDVAEISVRGHADWVLSIDGSALVRVAYGQATLPRPLIDFDEFKDTAERAVGTIDISRVWAIVREAQASGYGTTLVVSSDPEAEARRLGAAVTIAPEYLEPATIVRLGRVDGAVVLGQDGRCYAFGVILDGTAGGSGDPSRGSRFNSAVRYQSTTTTDAMLVVISDDGIVDLLPQLRPRMHRDEVEEAVRAFSACCEATPVDGEEFVRTHDRVEKLAFYLDESQCNLVNELFESEMQRRLEAGGSRLGARPLRPHPDMDESYFL